MAEDTQPSQRSQVIALSVIDVDILFSVGAMADESEFSFDVEITRPEPVEEGIFAFQANLQVIKRKEGETSEAAGFKAKYWCGFQLEAEDDATEIASQFASTTIWAAFSNLFAVVKNQMGVYFPQLPPAPGKIKAIDQPTDYSGKLDDGGLLDD
ncbi:protein of unknown function [Pseudorhizobium banfieldiae]|uniref:Preprotein translocase subunit SecB n=1 Tax=Pseudorhizobium banfieldiae TaxID=1125847 RepID=L0NBZ5_9HYPH|nr:hypothetical protein [Pseudorhizobium banfieldiae]CAD6603106.1 hypothetical protein RNT25_01288 [arsenite-oxidising bacterium NT-25]CAD6608877.1 hypothetical protein RTCK_02131 [Rhizobium sp. TCK]CCF18618.1 protein of unknown function [Pseudorhizobium banfieldiae]